VRIQLQNHGFVWLADARDKDASHWMSDTAPADAQWFGPTMVLEWRYVTSYANAAREAGVEVEVVAAARPRCRCGKTYDVCRCDRGVRGVA
jgi:hypothetical protein